MVLHIPWNALIENTENAGLDCFFEGTLRIVEKNE